MRLPGFLSGQIVRGWEALSGAAEAELVPQARLAGPMPWIIAIMVTLTVIASAAGLSLRNSVAVASDQLAGGITVQIIEASPQLRDRQAVAAAQKLIATPGVSEVHVVSQDEVERLIEPWLGMQIGGDEGVPVPALIDARLRDAVTGETLGALRRSVREVAPAARVDAQSSWLRPVFGALAALKWLAAGLVALLAVVSAAAVLLAVRNALGANRETIEIVHLLGGTDQQVARLFQRSIGFDALIGGAAGLVLGGAAVWFVGSRFAALQAGFVSGGALGWADWALLVLVPVAVIVLAMFTARLTVMRSLRGML